MTAEGIGRRPHHRQASGDGVQFRTSDGLLVLLEPSRELPLVDLSVTFRTGSVHDPEGLEGLTRMFGRMVRMGTPELDGNTVEETIAKLGGRLGVETSTSYVRFHGTVIKRNLQPFAALMSCLLRRPAFRVSDLAFVKRETRADIVAARDNDRALASRNFRRFLFRGHAYGRPVVGLRRSIRAIRCEDVRTQYARHFVAPNLILGASGDITEAELLTLVDEHFSDLPRGRAPKIRVPAPARPRGRHVLIVDKPERTQTQLYIGTLGARVNDVDLYPMLVANTAFGGTFTARLMYEVRSQRGWSYGAYSRLGQDRQRDAWTMWTFPAARDLAACARLQLDMLDDFVKEGISRRELRFAKKFLVNSHCFDIDTSAKRLEARIDNALFDLPTDHHLQYVRAVRGVKLDAANAAVKKRISRKHLAICVVATAQEVRAELEALPGVESVEVIRYDRD